MSRRLELLAFSVSVKFGWGWLAVHLAILNFKSEVSMEALRCVQPLVNSSVRCSSVSTRSFPTAPLAVLLSVLRVLNNRTRVVQAAWKAKLRWGVSCLHLRSCVQIRLPTFDSRTIPVGFGFGLSLGSLSDFMQGATVLVSQFS